MAPEIQVPSYIILHSFIHHKEGYAMFTKAHLNNITNPAIYKRGQELYRLRNVSGLRVAEDEEIPEVYKITAQVLGSSYDRYQVEVSIDEEFHQIDDYNCSCPAYYKYDGLCKHCIATVLAYIDKRDKEAGELSDKQPVGTTMPAFLKTNRGLSELMKFYDKNAKISLAQHNLKGKIELTPYVSESYEGTQVEFKIGQDKKYVIKHIGNFINAVEKGEEVGYGVKLKFYHTLECFTATSKKLIRFLSGEIKRREMGYHSYYYRADRDNRYLRLSEYNLDEFISAIESEPLEMGFFEDYVSMWQVERGLPEMELLVRGEVGGVSLQGKFPSLALGIDYFYIWEPNVIYKVPRMGNENLIPFLESVEKEQSTKMTIASTELPLFCRELLPVLRQHYAVEVENFDELVYLPPKAEFEIYLDSPQKDMITAKVYAVYGESKYNVYAKTSGRAGRDEMGEIRTGQAVASFFNAYDEKEYMMVLSESEEALYYFVTEGIEQLQELGTVYVSDAIKNMQLTSAPKVSVGISLSGDLLEFSIHSEEMSMDQLAEILSRYDRKRKYFRLKSGMFVNMEEGELGVLSGIRSALQLTENELKNGKVLLPKFRALYLDSELKEHIGIQTTKDKTFKSLIRNMKTVEDNDFDIPESLNNTLREYQKQGFLWIKTLKMNGFGGILADDMGLGKTLQVIAMFLSEILEGEERESLIVCPASLVYNWYDEFKRFAPSILCQMVIGSAAYRRSVIEEAEKGRILITSYDLLKRDSSLYEGKTFACEIIDEAQYIKNHNTHAAKAVKLINAGFKLALTGTPIENRLSELWSIFDYLMPGFLYGYQRFREELEIPIVQNQDQTALQKLQKMIRPFVLRRLKKDVLKDLPDKLEENMVAQLEGEQGEIYRAHVQRIRLMLEKQSDEEFKKGKIQILSELTKLRQICCDPALLLEGYKGESAKLNMCMEIIQNAVDGGHKLLLFSQFTTMLERIQNRLTAQNISFYSLTGATPKETRASMVESFNKGDVQVFCISLKAGGTGLNLTAADMVIHYDPWWNVAVQNQATDRAHRIGQQNVVTVYKLIAKDTIEENIMKLQDKKKELAEELLGGDELKTPNFTKEELLEFL